MSTIKSIKVILTKAGTEYDATKEYKLHDYIVVGGSVMYICKRVDESTMTCKGHSLDETDYWDKSVDLSGWVSEAETATSNAKSATEAAKTATTKTETATANAESATSAAKTATSNAEAATDEANTAKDNAVEATTATQTATADLKTWLGSILPTGLVVKCLTWITKGNLAEKRIDAILTPDNAAKNVIYLSDNKSVAVDPFGRISVVGTGKSTVHVIPTMNTALAKTVIIEVGEPSLRMTSQTSMRFTSTGALRFN